MSLNDSVKNGKETKQQSNQKNEGNGFKQTLYSTSKKVDLGKGIIVVHACNDSKLLTNEEIKINEKEPMNKSL